MGSGCVKQAPRMLAGERKRRISPPLESCARVQSLGHTLKASGSSGFAFSTGERFALAISLFPRSIGQPARLRLPFSPSAFTRSLPGENEVFDLNRSDLCSRCLQHPARKAPELDRAVLPASGFYILHKVGRGWRALRLNCRIFARVRARSLARAIGWLSASSVRAAFEILHGCRAIGSAASARLAIADRRVSSVYFI